MKIAIIGYGKMGKEIEKIAQARNHQIVAKFDLANKNEFTVENLKKANVAIEFTTPETAYENILKCFEANIPVVSGTTGWLSKFDKIEKICKTEDKTFFYASNFSLGVNIFFKINEVLAKIMNNQPSYGLELSETHHIHKLDAPSGTAITIAEKIIKNLDRKKSWTQNNPQKNEIKIESFREGEVFGIHKVKYESDLDKIELSHSLKNRKGLSLGAVIAAEFVLGKKGIFTMEDLLKW